MHSTSLPEQLDKISSFLISESKSISTNLSDFGYKERVKIERCLFLLMKTLCKKEINYDLQGFSKFHVEKISYSILNNVPGKTLNLIVDQAFQLKNYLQTISSENAYVRGDALSKLGLNRKSVYTFIQGQIKSIVNKAHSLNVKQTH